MTKNKIINSSMYGALLSSMREDRKMTSKKALNYLTSKVFTGGNSILEMEAEECKKIILQSLERLEQLKKVIEILKCFINYVEVDFDTFVTSQCNDEEQDLLKEVLSNDTR